MELDRSRILETLDSTLNEHIQAAEESEVLAGSLLYLSVQPLFQSKKDQLLFSFIIFQVKIFLNRFYRGPLTFFSVPPSLDSIIVQKKSDGLCQKAVPPFELKRVYQTSRNIESSAQTTRKIVMYPGYHWLTINNGTGHEDFTRPTSLSLIDLQTIMFQHPL